MKRSMIALAFCLFLSGCALTSDPVPPVPHAEAHAVVFDIDGTLTPDVLSVYSVRPKAAQAAHLYAEKGYAIIYLTARVSFLQSGIPSWLEKHEFPEGSLHVTESKADKKDHAGFKARVLKHYVESGWQVVYAYGDSSSDFDAYLDAGIPQEHIFALLRSGDEQCQPGSWNSCLETWENHLDYISQRIPDRPLMNPKEDVF